MAREAMRARLNISRKTTVGLAALVLALAASLGLSSVAWSSDQAPARPATSQGPSSQQVEKLLKRRAAHARAAICRGPHRRQFPCRGHKASHGKKLTAGQRKLLRTHFDTNDPVCPYWSVSKPWTGYATVATDANAWCIEGIAGHDIAGGTFNVSQSPEYAVLNLWAHHGGTRTKWSTSGSLGGCYPISVDYVIFVWHVEYAVICSIHLFVHAPVFPPAGLYHGQLLVFTYRPIWTDAQMINVNSELLCYYCRT